MWGYPQDASGTFGYFTYDTNAHTFQRISFPAPYNSSQYLVSIYGINDAGAIAVSAHLPNQESTFFILNPDGTAAFPPITNGNIPGSLNNSDMFVVSGWLGGPATNPTQITWPAYSNDTLISASGLNNNGVITGYVTYGPYASTAFTRDPSGAFSEVICNSGIPASEVFPQAINDNGVIAGRTRSNPALFIATPQPGLAQFSASPGSVDFGTAVSGVQSPAQNFTVSNSGTARLDFGSIRMASAIYACCSDANFTVSGCIAGSVSVTSLSPGANCMVSVTPAKVPTQIGVLTDQIIFDDSSAGAPHIIPVSMNVAPDGNPPVPPTCQLASVNPGPEGYVGFNVQDASSGIASITVVDSTNFKVNIPIFAVGATTPIQFLALELDPVLDSQVDIQVAGIAGLTATCGTKIYGSADVWRSLGGSFIGKPAAILDSTGRLNVFIRNSDNSIWHTEQVSPGSNDWTSFDSIGGVAAGDPAVGKNADGRLEVFVPGTDGGLWHNVKAAPGAGWTGWQPLGAALLGTPVVIQNPAGELEAFIRYTDSSIWTISQTAPSSFSWSAWSSLGGYILADPAVAIDSADLNLRNGRFRQRSQGRQNVATGAVIAARRRRLGKVEIFAHGGGDGLWRITEISPGLPDPNGWTAFGGKFSGSPVVETYPAGNLDVFVRGSDNALWHILQDASTHAWGQWTSLGGPSGSSQPAASEDPSGTLEVFAQDFSGALSHTHQVTPGGPWAVWLSLGAYLEPGITTARDADGRIEIFGRALDINSSSSSSTAGFLWHIAQPYPGFWD
jgi:hypothetical protein